MKQATFVVCVVVAASLAVFTTRRTAGQAALAAAPQTYKPAIEYQSFTQLRFYENQGGFLVEDLEVVFPPAASRRRPSSSRGRTAT